MWLTADITEYASSLPDVAKTGHANERAKIPKISFLNHQREAGDGENFCLFTGAALPVAEHDFEALIKTELAFLKELLLFSKPG